MKSNNYVLLLILITGMILPRSCYKEVSEEFVGTWETELTRVEIPVEYDDGSEDFFNDSVTIRLTITADKLASGYIGMASFEDVPVKKNPGDAESKGIAYIVKCGELGTIFPGDPADNKEIIINLSPVEGNIMGSEINYIRQWLEMFPFMIADPDFHRVN